LVEKSEGKRTIGRDKHRWEVHINIYVMKYDLYVKLMSVARNIKFGRLVRACCLINLQVSFTKYQGVSERAAY
jgi:hypothetical protein